MCRIIECHIKKKLRAGGGGGGVALFSFVWHLCDSLSCVAISSSSYHHLCKMPKGVKTARKAACKRERARELAVEEPGISLYARVTTMLGNARMRVLCSDNSEKLAHIRGNMRRRDYIQPGDMVLVTLRDFEQGKVDVVFKYSGTEASQLIKYDPSFARLALSDGLMVLTATATAATAAAAAAAGASPSPEDIIFAEDVVDVSLI